MSTPTCLDPEDPNAQWPYCPSYTAAIAFTALFGIVTLAHFVQAFAYRKRFCWVICMASTWETVGFAFRIMGARDPTNSTWPLIAQMLVLLAPLWVNAFVYMVVGRMVYYWLPEKRVWGIRATALTRWFVWFDVIVFLIQATGGTMLSGTGADQIKIGLDVYMSGIGVQQGFLLGFLGLMITFHVKALREGKTHDTRFQPLLYALYLALTLISVRIIFRLAEFSSGLYGPIPTHESYFYALEATPMCAALAALAIMHPGRYLCGPDSEFAKPIVTKGDRRWWCCGRRKRTRVEPDYDTPKWAGDESTQDGVTGYKQDSAPYRQNSNPYKQNSGPYRGNWQRLSDVPLTAQFPLHEREREMV